jgi:NAD(P)-dependent dehydrogenase (short-subunit alcohol dehydrogenase family)
MSELLAGKVVLVAGVGPGLGRENALACARHGADVVLAARTQATLDEVARDVEALGRRALAVATDVSQDADCRLLARAAMTAFGRIDALVFNAFRMPPFQPLVEQSLDVIRKTFEVNLFAALRLSREVAPHMAAAGTGSIVMINSSVMRHTRPAFGAYKMAKHALLAMARSLAAELGPQGIRVNSLAPGFVGRKAAEGLALLQSAQTGVPAERVVEEILESHMLRHIPEPDEIAESVVFLVSDLSRVVTGQCLDVNAGEFTH